MVKIKINNQEYLVEEGKTVVDVCKELGIIIPTLCDDERLSKDTNCRVCVVETNLNDKLITSCNLYVSEGLAVVTDSERVMNARKDNIRLLWATHPNECVSCDKSGDCELEDLVYKYNIDANGNYPNKREFEFNKTNHFFEIDPRKCILCGKCVRMCDEIMGIGALGFKNRGSETYVSFGNDDFDEAGCVSCGNCVSVCPTGALTPKSSDKFRNWETKKTVTTCPYCGVGCQLELVTVNDKVVRVDPVLDSVNNGLLCVKGKFAFNFINHPNRLKTPLIKENGTFREASWDEAYSLIVKNAKKHMKTPRSIAGFASARCTNEENYLFQKLFRAVLKTNSVDHCARLCHASTVSGLATTLGSGAMTNSISEVINHDLIFVTGSNTTSTHPVIASYMKQARTMGAKLIVAEPRRIELADLADVFIQIEPGTNVALYKGMMHYIYKQNLYDSKFISERTENFNEFVKSIESFTVEEAASICGCDPTLIEKAAKMYAESEKAGIYYAMGVTQHSQGTNGVKSIANLAMMCGHIGKESTGINPLRGQNNVQGACDLGALPNNYPGYQKVFDEEAFNKFSKAWKVKDLDKDIGLTIPRILDGMVDDTVKFVYIMGENPMVSDPDINHVKEALENVDFLVVQDIFLTETAEFADVVLPASSYAEKEGTFTNTERRVQMVNKAIEPLEGTKPDWVIINELTNLLGYNQEYSSVEDIMKEINLVTPIYAGMDYKRIKDGGLQWPCKSFDDPGTKFLHKDKFSRGLGLFTPIEYVSPMEVADKEYPITLTTGRTLYHYHTATMTNKTEGINKIVPENFFEVSPNTAKKYSINDGDKIYISSRRGTTSAIAKVTDIIKDNVIFMPFHFAYGANVLTHNSLDEFCDIPELKVSAVKFDDKL